MIEDRTHYAANAEERNAGVCRTCLEPIWNEDGTVGGVKTAGWSDRIETGVGDSVVCYRAADYRHVPLAGREAVIYDHAYKRGAIDGFMREPV